MLNDLFEQIFHSEATFKEKIAHLKNVNTERLARSSYLKDLEQQYRKLLKSYTEGQKALVVVRQQETWQRRRETILATQLECQILEVDSFGRRKEKLENDMDVMRRQFTLDAKAFSSAHDLAGLGRDTRISQAQRDQTMMAEETDQLQQEMLVLAAECRSVDQLESDILAADLELQGRIAKRKDLLAQLEDLQATSGHHEHQHQEEDSEDDPKFKQLQDELNVLQSERFELLCKELSNELDSLKAELSHKHDTGAQTRLSSRNKSKQFTESTPQAAHKIWSSGKQLPNMVSRGTRNKLGEELQFPDPMSFESFWSDDDEESAAHDSDLDSMNSMDHLSEMFQANEDEKDPVSDVTSSDEVQSMSIISKSKKVKPAVYHSRQYHSSAKKVKFR